MPKEVETVGNQEVLCWAKGVFGTTQPFSAGFLSLYVIESEGEALLVDAGAGENECSYRLLDEVGVPANRTTLWLTHLHRDHTGNASQLASEGARLEMRRSRNEGEPFDPADVFRLAGFEAGPSHRRTYHQIDANASEAAIGHPIEKLDAGETVRIGSRTFRVIEFAGHAKGHGGLYEEETGIVFTGDQIIDGIVPAVTSMRLDRHDMERFHESLEAVRALHPRVMFPAHLHPVFGEQAIDEVIDGIEDSFGKIVKKAGDILAARDEWMTAAEFARVFYGYRVGGFATFSTVEQAFRLTKLLAYFEELCDQGRAQRRIDDDGSARYRIAPPGPHIVV